MKKYLSVIAIFIFMLMIVPDVSYAESKWDQVDVEPNKVWTITFNKELSNSPTSTWILVEDSKGNRVQTINRSIDSTNKKIIITNSAQYEYGETYSLHVPTVIKSIDGEPLEEDVRMKFTIKEDPLLTAKDVKNMRWDAGVSDSYWGYYSGEILNGVPHGFGEWVGDENGRSYKGTFLNGKFHGFGTYKWPTGEVYEGDYFEGDVDGYGTYTIDGVIVYSGKFVKGEMIDRPLRNITTEYDYIEDITWFYDKERYEEGIFPAISLDGVFPYIGQRGDGAPWLRLVIYTNNRKWFYPKEYIVRTDNNVYTITPSYRDINRRTRNDTIFSWDHLEEMDMHVDNSTLEMLYDLVNSKNNVYVRVKGSNADWDILLADKYKLQIKNVLNAYEYLNNSF